MKKCLLRGCVLLLVLALLVPAMAACANKGTPMLTLKIDGEKYTYSVNLYQMQLCILKGNLISAQYTINGYSPYNISFWSTTDDFGDGNLKTVDEHYREVVMDECRYVLIAQYLFDKYGLELSASDEEAIEEYLNEFVQTDGDGNKNKLNTILSEYGINYDMLEEYLIMSTKLAAVQEYLYGRLGHNVKQKYLEESYVHYDMLFLANYDYVYVTDDHGDEIYYDEDTGEILYDQSAPYSDYSGAGGTKVWYWDADCTRIAYDTENGVRQPKLTEDGTEYETAQKTPAQLEALRTEADYLEAELQNATAAKFASFVEDHSSADPLEDGYYLLKNVDYSEVSDSYEYLDQIIKKLEEAEVGDVFCVSSSLGYHIIMKQEHTDRAYELEANEAWFEASSGTSFEEALTSKIFKDECDKYYDKVTLDQKVYEECPPLKDVTPNFFYK